MSDTESAKDILQTAALRAEDVVQIAADKAEAILFRHADERTEAIAERAATRAIDGFFMRLGVDASNPISMQKDFAFVRSTRESFDLVQRRGLLTAVTVVVTGFMALVYAAITHRF